MQWLKLTATISISGLQSSRRQEQGLSL